MQLAMPRSFVLGFLLTFLALPLAAQEGTAPVVRSAARVLDVGARLDAQFNTSTVDTVAPAEWIMRRIRMDMRAQVTELVSGRVVADFAQDRLSVKDAYIQFGFDPGFAVLVGRAWRPFSLIQVTSSARMLPIERGARIRGAPALEQYELVSRLAYAERDLGIQFQGAPRGAPLDLTYAVGWFAGPLQGRVGNRHTQQFAGRVTVVPLSPLRVGAGWSSRDFAQGFGSAPGTPALRRGHAFEIDAQFGSFAPGLLLMGEATTGDYDPFTGDRFSGVQGLAGYRMAGAGRWVTAIEPLIRASHGSIATDDRALANRAGTLVTPGVNVYFGSTTRAQANYDLWRSAAGDEGSFKMQVQMVF